MKKGVFCITLDTELLWGRHDRNYQDFIWRARKTRPIIKKLLSLFAKYQIPATWAVVGSLFLQPDSRNKNSDLWHAPDIVKEIKKHKNQEIASHSFSHPEFDRIEKKEAEVEIKKCLEAAKKEGIKLTTFIFPRNKVGHLGLLRKHGFTAFRGSDLRSWELLAPWLPPVYTPGKVGGLINIPGSMYFVSARGIRRYLPVWLRVYKAKAGIRAAAEKKKVFHLWFHPIDLADSPRALLGGLEEILHFAKEAHDNKLLEIKTMAQVAKDAER